MATAPYPFPFPSAVAYPPPSYSFPAPISTTVPMYATATHLPPHPYGFGAPPYAPYHHSAAAYAPPPGFFPTPAPPATGIFPLLHPHDLWSTPSMPSEPAPPIPTASPTCGYSTDPAAFTFPYSQVHAPPPESTAPSTPSPPNTAASGWTPPSDQPCVASSTSLSMPIAVLDLKRQLDEQQARDRTSFETLHGELAKLTSMAAQLAVSIGKQANSAIPGSSPLGVTGTAPVASKVFDTMPTPSSACSKVFGKQSSAAESSSASSLSSPVGASSVVSMPMFASDSGNGTGSTTTVSTTSLLLSSGPSVFSVSASNVPSTATDIAPQVFGEMHKPRPSHRKYSSPLHYYQEQEDSIQSTCVPDRLSNFSEQNLDGMPQSYGFGNLHRRSILLADGIEQTYYALPEDYPLEHATPLMSPSAAHNIGVTAQLPVPAQAADVSSKLPKEMHVHTVSDEEHQEIEQLPKYYSESSKNPLPGAVSEFTLADNVDVSVATYKQRQCIPQLLEYAYTPGCAMGDVLLIDYKWNMVLSEEGREVWDPGASTPLHSSKPKPREELSYVAIGISKVLHLCNQFGTYGQQLRDSQFTVLVIHERRREWDPGPSLPLMSRNNQHASQALQSASHAPILTGSSVTRFSVYKCLPFWVQNNTYVLWKSEIGMPTYMSWDPGVLKNLDMLLEKYTVPSYAQFMQRAAEFSSLSLTVGIQYMTSNDNNSVLQDTSFILQKATPFSQGSYLGSLYCNSLLKIEYCPMRCLWKFLLTCVPQQSYCCRVPSSQQSNGIQFSWDPGILILPDMLLGKTVVPNRIHSRQTLCTLVILIGRPVSRNQVWTQLVPCLPWSQIPNAFLEVQYCCLPCVLDCSYSEPIRQLVCCSRMLSSTEALLSAICMSIASTLFMILVLSFEEIAEEPDVAAAYQVSNIQLPMRQTTHDWNPGINSLLLVYIWLLSSQKYLQIKEMDIILITHLPP